LSTARQKVSNPVCSATMNEQTIYPSRRSKQTHDAILSATLELVNEKGYFGLSLEAVAARAGAGKQTIYRWWPSKAALVMEALSQAATREVALPDTGRVEQDLFLFLEAIFTRISSSGSGKAMGGLVAEAQADPIFAEAFRSGFVEARREGLRTLLRRGMERGEVNSDIDLELAVDTLFGPMWYRLLLLHAPLDGPFARDLVRQFMTGNALHRG